MSLRRDGVMGSAVAAPGMPMAGSTAEAIAAPTPVMPLSPAPLMPSGSQQIGSPSPRQDVLEARRRNGQRGRRARHADGGVHRRGDRRADPGDAALAGALDAE